MTTGKARDEFTPAALHRPAEALFLPAAPPQRRAGDVDRLHRADSSIRASTAQTALRRQMMGDMDVELIRLSLGAFLTSPGFAGLAALAAALVALWGVSTRVEVERDLAREGQRHATAEARAAAERTHEEGRQAEALVRWWDLTRWINIELDRETADRDLLMSLLVELEELVTTREQSIMLEFLTKRLLQVDTHQPHD